MEKQKLIEINVIPNSSKNELIKIENGYKAKITASPVDGKANEALIMLVSKQFGVPKSSVEIIKGKTNKKKFIAIN